jgi:hypothetical protein
MLRGTPATAAALCERGLTISREAEITFVRPRLSALLGYVEAVSGDADAGVVTLRAARGSAGNGVPKPVGPRDVAALRRAARRGEIGRD